jgi:branched-subunit amino acid aminotransferase/4-amino-4-deoxychorismate lyase
MIVNIDGSFIDPKSLPAARRRRRALRRHLFETLKARDGRIRFLDEHLDRIELAARLLVFPSSASGPGGASGNGATAGRPRRRLRLTLTRGPFTHPAAASHTGTLLHPPALPEPTASERAVGATCVVAPNRRVNPLSHLPQMKRGNYADCLYAADFARRRGAREALFGSAEGCVLEGATSNLFALQGDVLVTPPAGELVLAGIMRRQVLRAAAGLGLQVKERDLPLDELFAADEVFLSNSLIDLLPVSQLEGAPAPRTLAERLRAATDGLADERESTA